MDALFDSILASETSSGYFGSTYGSGAPIVMASQSKVRAKTFGAAKMREHAAARVVEAASLFDDIWSNPFSMVDDVGSGDAPSDTIAEWGGDVDREGALNKAGRGAPPLAAVGGGDARLDGESVVAAAPEVVQEEVEKEVKGEKRRRSQSAKGLRVRERNVSDEPADPKTKAGRTKATSKAAPRKADAAPAADAAEATKAAPEAKKGRKKATSRKAVEAERPTAIRSPFGIAVDADGAKGASESSSSSSSALLSPGQVVLGAAANAASMSTAAPKPDNGRESLGGKGAKEEVKEEVEVEGKGKVKELEEQEGGKGGKKEEVVKEGGGGGEDVKAAFSSVMHGYLLRLWATHANDWRLLAQRLGKDEATVREYAVLVGLASHASVRDVIGGSVRQPAAKPAPPKASSRIQRGEGLHSSPAKEQPKSAATKSSSSSATATATAAPSARRLAAAAPPAATSTSSSRRALAPTRGGNGPQRRLGVPAIVEETAEEKEDGEDEEEDIVGPLPAVPSLPSPSAFAVVSADRARRRRLAIVKRQVADAVGRRRESIVVHRRVAEKEEDKERDGGVGGVRTVAAGTTAKVMAEASEEKVVEKSAVTTAETTTTAPLVVVAPTAPASSASITTVEEEEEEFKSAGQVAWMVRQAKAAVSADVRLAGRESVIETATMRTSIWRGRADEQRRGRRAADAPPSAATSTAAVPSQETTGPTAVLLAMLPLVLDFASARELLHVYPRVCRSFSQACRSVYAWRASEVSEEGAEEEEGGAGAFAPLQPRSATSGTSAGAAAASGPRSGAAVAADVLEARRRQHEQGLRGVHADGCVEEVPGEEEGASLRLRLGVPVVRAWDGLQRAFPRGAFLAEGAYKKVFRVWSALRRRAEAVAVLDVAALAATGAWDVVRSEVATGELCAELVRTRTCPSFVTTHQVFLHSFAPDALWALPKHADLAPPTLEAQMLERQEKRTTEGPISEQQPITTQPITSPPIIERPAESGVFQYIRMELCVGGDLEGALREWEPRVRAAEQAANAAFPGKPHRAPQLAAHGAFVTSTAFQMVVALFAAQKRLHLRHLDLKLLNWLCMPVKHLEQGSSAAPAAGRSLRALSFRIAGIHFRVPVLDGTGAALEGEGGGVLGAAGAVGAAGAAATAYVVKLADFGTADTRVGTMGSRLVAANVTTFENVPPEILLFGDAARQTFACDTWALGLCLLHLLTGSSPYEELMKDVLCPEPLRLALDHLWATRGAKKPAPSASARHGGGRRRGAAAAASRDFRRRDPDKATTADPSWVGFRQAWELDDNGADSVLPHTLYRYCVLLGLPSTRRREKHVRLPPDALHTPVAQLLWALLDPSSDQSEESPDPALWPVADADRASCAQLFLRDCEQWSLKDGLHPSIQRLRARCKTNPGLWKLLHGWLSWDPAQRWTMSQSLLCDAFAPLRVPSAADGTSASQPPQPPPRTPTTTLLDALVAAAKPKPALTFHGLEHDRL